MPKSPFLGFRLRTPSGDLCGAAFVDHYSVVRIGGGIWHRLLRGVVLLIIYL